MPYVLSPLIKENMQGMWQEGSPYSKKTIYKIAPEEAPPVNYDSHEIKAHSLTHIEAPKHIDNNGKSVEHYFSGSFFYGKCSLVRLKGNNYKKVSKGIFHWEVAKQELLEALYNIVPNKLILTTDIYKKNTDGFHDPNYVLTLGQEAADWLISNPKFNLYGTSWKSSDFCPGSSKRPIHSTLFSQAVILECLDLENVPAGEYFLNCFPLNLNGASESPVTPVLFTKDEVLSIFE